MISCVAASRPTAPLKQLLPAPPVFYEYVHLELINEHVHVHKSIEKIQKCLTPFFMIYKSQVHMSYLKQFSNQYSHY